MDFTDLIFVVMNGTLKDNYLPEWVMSQRLNQFMI